MKNGYYKEKDQVFISFRGKDNRFGFLSHLKQKLIDGNINVLTDEDLTGKPLQDIFTHIQNSRIVIVIFSKNYAESEWCLNELVEIKKCIKEEKIKVVIPIFHKVKVASVKKQSGKFGEKFLALQNSLLSEEGITKKKIKLINSKIKRWKRALEVVTGMIGLSYVKNSPESEFAEKLLAKVNLNLAKIIEDEGLYSTSETTKKLQGKQQSNQIIFNISQLNINSQLSYSTTLEALNLGRWHSQGYNMSVDSIHFSQDFRRINSDLDHRDQYGPFPFEAILVRKQDKDPRTCDTTCLSFLCCCLRL